MDTKISRQGAGIAAMAACAFLWSLAGLFIKLIDWNPFAIACGRSLVAAVFLFLWIRKPLFTFSRAQIGAALASAVTMLLFIYANKATTSANAILLQYGAPVYVAIIGSFALKEKPRAEHWVGFVAVAVGLVLFFLGDIGGGSLVGNLAAAASGVSFALYIVFMRMQKEGSPLESSLLAHILTAAVAFGFALFLPAPRISFRALAVIGALGVVQIGLATVFLAYGIKRVTAVQGILVAVIEPLFNPFWVFLATAETPGANALAGGGLIVAAVVASSIISVRRSARSSSGQIAATRGSPTTK